MPERRIRTSLAVPPDIAHLRALLIAATPGPWIDPQTMGAVSSIHPDAIARFIGDDPHGPAHAAAYGGALVGESIEKPNRDLIIAMHEALPGLLDELEALRAERKERA